MNLFSQEVTNSAGDPLYVRHRFHCPGCEISHFFHTPIAGSSHSGDLWEWDGKLTFSPSLLMTHRDRDGSHRCHLFLIEGQIHFLSDCTHHLAGAIVPLAELEPP